MSSEMPPLKVQRMGKLFRIVYTETRNLARYNSGDPVDDGGFDTEEEAMIHLAKVTGGSMPSDPEGDDDVG